jgi:phosphate:Na+ symporter
MITSILFESSSATTLLTIGMVSAGLISFYSSLGLILGADIGTTFTVQLVVWKLTAISPVFVILGGIIWAARKNSCKSIGEPIFDFGLIFFGLSLVTTAYSSSSASSPFYPFVSGNKKSANTGS